jgi:hypothetical protein
MSLRIIVKSDQIRSWIEERKGRPARRRNTDDDPTVLFDGDKPATAVRPEYETLSVDELLEAMKANHLVLMVDQEPDKTFFKFIQHG